MTLGLVFAFLVNGLGPIPVSEAQEFVLPKPGAMVPLSPEFNPPILKGIKVHSDNPFQFDFILDKGDSRLGSAGLREESLKLIKYFLTGLTVPEKDLWVNLSPYEKNRIIPQSFGLTEMGRDLLAEDYMLKQITASLIYPDGKTGREFWKRVYEEAARKYGTTNVPVNTFNKVWIVPQKAVVYENVEAGTAYVVQARLKVMLEQDYLSLEKHQRTTADGVNSLGSRIVRQIVIPQLTREVNEDKNFAPLRQVYNSLILAAWYKKKIKDSILAQVYADKDKIAGVGYGKTIDVASIYHRYLQAFKKGVFNFVQEDTDPVTDRQMPRKYFSGGFDATDFAQMVLKTTANIDYAQLAESPRRFFKITAGFSMAFGQKHNTPMNMQEWDKGWDKVTFEQVDSRFNQWVQSGQMDLQDLSVLKQILSGNEKTLKKLIRNSNGKVDIKAIDKQSPRLNGRTVYLRLSKPFFTSHGEITVLSIKGARPVTQGLEVRSHFGAGFVEAPFAVDHEGNLLVKARPLLSENVKPWSLKSFLSHRTNRQIDPTSLTPQGTMLQSMAEKTYDLMETGQEGKGFETDYPIAVGQWKNISHAGRPVGFVISGLHGEDIRINLQVPVVNPDNLVYNIITGRQMDTAFKESEKIYKAMGRSMRAYHDSGYFHQYPHNENWGVEFTSGHAIQVVLRDLDTTVTRREIRGEDPVSVESAYRLMDIQRIIHDITSRTARGMITPSVRNSIVKPLVTQFLEGYFYDLNFKGDRFKKLVSDVLSEKFRMMRADAAKDGHLVLNGQEQTFGHLWGLLYKSSEISRAHAENPARQKASPAMSATVRRHGNVLTTLSDQDYHEIVRSPSQYYVRKNEQGKAQLSPVEKKWQMVSSLLNVVNYELGILGKIKEIHQINGMKPLVILDWGGGDGTAAVELHHELEKNGIPHHIYVLSHDYFPDWEVAPSGITFILDDAENLPEYSRYLGKGSVDIIFSHIGLVHFLANTDFRVQGQDKAGHIRYLESLLKSGGVLRFDKYPVSNQKLLELGFPAQKTRGPGFVEFEKGQAAGLEAGNVRKYGGIDLTAGRMHLQTKATGSRFSPGIRFHLDPAMLAQLQNASGFVPVIINIQPVASLRLFLGLTDAQTRSTSPIDTSV
ncbi:MAG: class I SAM-dependent methyltransferase [Candidatus Omnitrophica bacterium]|nr:class I SAM-dependent methyltransferase [Candidatus Omnitrophota bacterium]